MSLRIVYRVVFVMFLAVMSWRAFAQTELGVSLNTTQFDTVELTEEGETVTIDFDAGVGFGISFTHYWTNAFSTEIAAQGFGGDMTIGTTGLPTFEAGELTAVAITGMGQFHFNREGRFSPYVGAGLAMVGGEFEPNPIFDEPSEPDEDGFDLETETTWVAGVGADIGLTQRLLLNLDVRYIRWSARAEDDEESESLDINPLLVSAGIKFRF